MKPFNVKIMLLFSVSYILLIDLEEKTRGKQILIMFNKTNILFMLLYIKPLRNSLNMCLRNTRRLAQPIIMAKNSIY